ncbi:hypothetical protein WMY93_014042 [Mugilogobius chulae]|uniref:Uncharacterized protein n=1 Tax=Mugilogobius chulae TaxID=88201 RepID=A0AAW0P3D8_9GOBI
MQQQQDDPAPAVDQSAATMSCGRAQYISPWQSSKTLKALSVLPGSLRLSLRLEQVSSFRARQEAFSNPLWIIFHWNWILNSSFEDTQESKMPRPKGWKRSLAARERRADQLAIGCRPYLSPPPPPDPKVVGTGWRHSAKKQNWPVSEHTDKCHKLVIPPACPGKKFVFVIGHSHLRAIVDRFVAMPEGCLSFGFSSTPGGSANDLHRELEQIALPREPDLALLLAPCNDLHASPTITDAGTAYGNLLQYLLGRFQKVLVLDFPTRIREDLEIQNLLRQEFRRVSAVWKTRYFPVAEHFPVHRRELWSNDGTHLSDDHGMGIYAQLMWQACYMELETPVPTPKVSHPPTSPSTRRVKPILVVTGPLPRTPPPPSEWTPAEQGRKKNQQRTPKSSPGGLKSLLVQPEVETVFSIPLSPKTFSPAMLIEMDKISPSHLGSFPKGKKAPQTRRRRAIARKNPPRDAVEATAVVVRPTISPASSTPGPEEHKPVEVSPRRSLTRSSPSLEVRPCSPASTPPAQEEDQAVVEVRSRSPQRPSYADVVKGLSPVPSTSGMAVKRSSPASSTSGMEEEVSRETIKPAAPKRRRFRRQTGAAPVLEVRPGSPASSLSEMEVDEEGPGVDLITPTSTDLGSLPEKDQMKSPPPQQSPSHHGAKKPVPEVPRNIRGSFHQVNGPFKYPGLQCMAVALVSLAKHSLCKVTSWQRKDLDRSLILGDELYAYCRENKKITKGSNLLLVPNLPKEWVVEGKTFNFNYGPCVSGVIGLDSGELIDNDVVVSLETGLETTLAEYGTCLFTTCGTTCAIIHENGVYAVIDSHSRSETGMLLEENGKSVVVYLKSLRELHSHFCHLADTLTCGNKFFEINGVKVSMVCNDLTVRKWARSKDGSVLKVEAKSPSFKDIHKSKKQKTANSERHDEEVSEVFTAQLPASHRTSQKLPNFCHART